MLLRQSKMSVLVVAVIHIRMLRSQQCYWLGVTFIGALEGVGAGVIHNTLQLRAKHIIKTQ
jgi:hypothetical protein